MVPVSEGKDEEVADLRFGIRDIREGWAAPELLAEPHPVTEHAVEGAGVLAGVGGGGSLESSAEVSCVRVESGRWSSCQVPGCG